MMRSAALLSFVLLAGACARPRIAFPPVPIPAPEQTGDVLADAPVSDPPATSDVDYLRARHLLIPVAGVRPDQMEDSFDVPRAGGRHHHAIDILAPRGTPVLSADDGRILRLSSNTAGGTTIYAVDPKARIVYYYAHLARYRDSLRAGMQLTRGDTIGFVGTTGNAPKNIPHLHFQIMRMPANGKYWSGEPINPFPLLEEATRR